jgi:hypothetical protein
LNLRKIHVKNRQVFRHWISIADSAISERRNERWSLQLCPLLPWMEFPGHNPGVSLSGRDGSCECAEARAARTCEMKHIQKFAKRLW